MKRSILIILIGFFVTATVQSQQKLTLQQCHQSAIQYFPITKQRQLLQQLSDFTLKNISTNTLPKISVNTQLTYQSDVTGLPSEFAGPSIPEIPKGQYKATLDIQQNLYNGGLTKGQKKIEHATLQVEQQKIEISEYELKERVNKFYFGILLLDESKALTELLIKELQDKISSMSSGVRNGIVGEDQLNELKAEIIKVEQNEIELISNRKALLDVLGLLMNQSLAENTSLVSPSVELAQFGIDSSRPEQLLFTYQSTLLEANRDLLGVSLKPQAFAFAQTGVGQPGLNFLDDQAQGFYIVGVKVKWDLWDWNKTNYSKQQVSIRQNIIATEKEFFDMNANAALAQKQNEMDKLNRLIDKDKELIALRTSIKETASSQLSGGIITTTDYLSKLNAESLSKLNHKVRVMELELAKIDYLMILGKEVTD